MEKLPRLSVWQTLFRNFERKVWNSENCTFRTETITGVKRETGEYPDIIEALANDISNIVRERNERFRLKNERRALFTKEEGKEEGEEEITDEDYNIAKEQLRELRGEKVEILDQEIGLEPVYVDPAQIDLIEVTKDSEIKANIFPLGFRCFSCGHFEIIDPRTEKDLKCPCCKYCPTCKKILDAKHSKCPDCGGKLVHREIEQYPGIFVCPRCGEIEEFVPLKQRIDDVRGSIIPCPQCGTSNGGHLHLYGIKSFQTAIWRCPTCGYREGLTSSMGGKYCKNCHIPRGPQGEESDSSIMKPTLTSAPSILYPLVKSYLYVGRTPINLENLLNIHEKTPDQYRWKLSENLHELEYRMIREIGIKEAFTIPKVTTTTVVYGCRSGMYSYPNVIEEEDRLAQTFTTGRYGRKHRVYLVNTEGRGLVIVLDKDKILRFSREELGCSGSPSYDDIINEEITFLTQSPFQYILEHPDEAKLTTLFHAFTHSCFQSLLEQVGLEVFGCKILLTDCAIVLYEREEVGSGGLVELAPPNTTGSEFIRFIRNTEEKLKKCRQLCNSACPACVFINDFYCHPFMPNEIERWFPPNSLLDRNLTNQFLKFRGTIKTKSPSEEMTK